MTFKSLEITKQTQIESLLKEFRYDLYNKNFAFDDLKQLSCKYADNAKVIVILDEHREHVGFVAFYCNDDVSHSAFISMIVVKKSCRHNGIGKKLLEIVLNKAKENGMQYIRLSVNQQNVQAQKFYVTQKFWVVRKDGENLVMKRRIV